jgi:hypothetical protein
MSVLGRLGFVLISLLVGNTSLFAQVEEFIKDEGEVMEGEFLISKELEITLPAAQRMFQKVPPDEINAKETETLQYTFIDYTPQLNDIQTRLRVLKLKDEKLTSKPGSYIKLGFGNYITPYLEAALNTGVNKKGNFGVKLGHLSSKNGPVDQENSGDQHSSINAAGRYTGKKASIGGDLQYYRDGYYFYGYDEGVEVDRDTIKQTFDDINLGFDIKSNDINGALQYKLFAKVYNTTDLYNAAEMGIKTGIQGKYKINDNMFAKLDLDFLYTSYKNPLQINRTLTRVKPAFIYKNNGLTMDIGMRIVNNSDTLKNTEETLLFPSLTVAYELNEDFSVYGILDGDVEEVTFRKMVKENPFVNSILPTFHTNKNVDIHIGVKGSLVQYLAFDVGVRSVSYKNLYFYVNDPNELSKFNVVYDRVKTSLIQGIASLSYVKSNTLGTTLSFRYNAYKTEELEKAWHRPKFELDYALWYNIYDKVKLSTELFVLTGIEAPEYGILSVTPIKLDAAVDLNIKVDYSLSEKYSVFVSANNILNSNYQLYNRYPTRGILAMVGLSVSF